MQTKVETPKFKPGDPVTWTSQAGGESKTKQGIVLIVVLAGRNLKEAITDEQWREFTYPYSFSSRRPHESYLIQVGKSKRLYWPPVKYLKLVEKGGGHVN